jgi:hypothetical protein
MLRASFLPQPIDAKRDKNLVISTRPTQGMITSIDPADIPNEAFVAIVNGRNRYDKTSRRNGHVAHRLAPPDSLSITKLYATKRLTGNSLFLRVTASGIHYLGSTGWQTIPDTPATLGSRPRLATVFDRILMVDGSNKVMYITPSGVVIPDGAPIARFVTSFYDRAVVAYTTESDGPIKIAWSAQFQPGNPDALRTWDFSVNETAGSQPLLGSPTDVSDHISGIQALSDTMFILRSRSVLLSSRQASATSPFAPFVAIPGVGSESPDSMKVIRGGLAFLDHRTRSVYVYNPGGQLERISVNVETDLFSDIGSTIDPVQVRSAYDPIFNEYKIRVGDRFWIFNFDTRGWSYDEGDFFDDVTTELEVDSQLIYSKSINELVGEINDLVGTINSLGGAVVSDVSSSYYGMNDGVIAIESGTADDDLGTAFNSVWESREFTAANIEIIISKFILEYNGTVDAEFKFEVTRDSGVTWEILRDWFIGYAGLSKIISIQDNVTSRRVRYRLTARLGKFSILKTAVLGEQGGSILDDSTNS